MLITARPPGRLGHRAPSGQHAGPSDGQQLLPVSTGSGAPVSAELSPVSAGTAGSGTDAVSAQHLSVHHQRQRPGQLSLSRQLAGTVGTGIQV